MNKSFIYALILGLTLWGTTSIVSGTGCVSAANSAFQPKLSNEQVVKALKEALTTGAQKSSQAASLVDGFYKNPMIFIPWPAEAQAMRDKLVKMGMQAKVTAFEESLNRAAEEAAKEAFPIFSDAVTTMSVTDGFAILNGGDTSATHYLREKTYTPLKAKFLPVVQQAISKTNVTSHWNAMATTYNKIPGVKKQNPNLDDYVTVKAINGLMLLISQEEVKIRKDPAARATDLMKEVFGFRK